MKIRYLFILLSLFCFSLPGMVMAQDTSKIAEKYGLDPDKMEYVPGEYIVRYETDRIQDLQAISRLVADTNQRMDLEVVRDYSDLGFPGLCLVRTDPGRSKSQVQDGLMATGAVKYCSPNYIGHILKDPFRPPVSSGQKPGYIQASRPVSGIVSSPLTSSPLEDSNKAADLKEKADIKSQTGSEVYEKKIPDDPLFGYLWNMDYAKDPSSIDALKAWNIATGNRSVVVAVIDTGIDYTHPDLAPNMWRDPESGGFGYNFVDENQDVMDDEGHGTHCAGIIGAVGNNRRGVAGVCWNVSIMAVKIFDSHGHTTHADIISGLLWAKNHGADLISNSWVCVFDPAVKEIIESSGVLNICAAGNEKEDNDAHPSYPASFDSPNIISVASTRWDNNLSDFSNYGYKSVDIAAPGELILSCRPWLNYSVTKPVFFDKFTTLNNWKSEGFTLTNRSFVSPPTSAGTSIIKGKNYFYLTLKKPVNISSLKEPYLGFKTRQDYDIADPNGIGVFLSKDLKNWTSILSAVHYDINPYFSWKSAKIPPGFRNGQIYVRFVYVNYFIEGQKEVAFFVDDFMIGEKGSPVEAYVYQDGTSMATPHVAGAAALIKSLHPEYSALKIRDAIFSGADVQRGLSKKISTGGRLNIYNSLGVYYPLIINITPDSGEAGSIIPVIRVSGYNLKSGNQIDFVKSGSPNLTAYGISDKSGLIIRNLSLVNASKGWYNVWIKDIENGWFSFIKAGFRIY